MLIFCSFIQYLDDIVQQLKNKFKTVWIRTIVKSSHYINYIGIVYIQYTYVYNGCLLKLPICWTKVRALKTKITFVTFWKWKTYYDNIQYDTILPTIYNMTNGRNSNILVTSTELIRCNTCVNQNNTILIGNMHFKS